MSIPFQKSLKGNFRGFTLVELLVVIAIISILATILLLQLGTARAKSRDVKRIADINQVRSAAELFFDDCGAYPATNAFASGAVFSCTGVTINLAPRYLASIPVDPLTTGCTGTYSGAGCYGYAAIAAPVVKYQLWTELEQSNKAALGTDTDVNVGAVGDWAAGSGVGTNGTIETCVDNLLTTINCVFDLGIK